MGSAEWAVSDREHGIGVDMHDHSDNLEEQECQRMN